MTWKIIGSVFLLLFVFSVVFCSAGVFSLRYLAGWYWHSSVVIWIFACNTDTHTPPWIFNEFTFSFTHSTVRGQALLDRWALLFKVNSAIFLSRHGSRAFLNAVVGPAVPLIEGAFPQAYAYSIAAAFFCFVRCSVAECRVTCLCRYHQVHQKRLRPLYELLVFVCHAVDGQNGV